MVGLKKNNTTYIVHDNLRGDVESITDTSGNIVAQAHYDPWGNQISASGSLVQPLRYAGYYYDDETGLYYLKSRYYSPTLGRFLVRDGIGYVDFADPQTLNLYSYCGNNPVSLTDPNGNWASEIERLWAEQNMSEDDYNNLDSWSSEYGMATKARQLQLNHDANDIRARYNIPSFGPTASSATAISGLALLSKPWHTDYGLDNSKYLHWKDGKYDLRFNKNGKLVEHSGKIIGDPTGREVGILETLMAKVPKFFNPRSFVPVFSVPININQICPESNWST